jgi:hypothetical protein
VGVRVPPSAPFSHPDLVSIPKLRTVACRLTAALAFAGMIAAIVVLLGTRDLESYEHVFVSLDRGTGMTTVRVQGHPVYTLALGLGVRLPLQGSVAGSPAVRLAPFLPDPLAYWLILTLSIAAAVLIAQHALEPFCGASVSWLAMLVLFWSIPIVNYTIYDDWIETTLTYCACIACVFAPHAFLTLLDPRRSTAERRVGGTSLAAGMFGLMTTSHAGHWPIMAASLVTTSVLSLLRSDHVVRLRLTVVFALALVSMLAVAPQVPDIMRELNAARSSGPGELTRITEGGDGNFVRVNVFPPGPDDSRKPFTHLLLALVSIAVALTRPGATYRRFTIYSGCASIAVGAAAATLPAAMSPAAPTLTWLLRDPAAVLAVFSAASAAGSIAIFRKATGSLDFRAGAAVVALVLAAAQGPGHAVRLVSMGFPDLEGHRPWTHEMTTHETRAAKRGLVPERVPPGGRLALWTGVRARMRNMKFANTDFADAGYPVVTAWTKQRTMRALVAGNDELFNQAIELTPEVLCNKAAVQFLQLRYLLRPLDSVPCEPWTPLDGLLVDHWLRIEVAEADHRVRAAAASHLAGPLTSTPALSPESTLLPTLVPLAGSAVTVTGTDVRITLENLSAANGHVIVLPVAYDRSWHASSGTVHPIGGLVAVTGVDRRDVTLEFVPDFVAVLRATAMSVSQILYFGALLGLAYSVGPRLEGAFLLRTSGTR